MKVKNEYVKINIGKNKIELRNTIFQNYIDMIMNNQLLTSNRNDLQMYSVYVKFDDTLSFDESTPVNSTDFNLAFQYTNIDIQNDKTAISVLYRYDTIPERFKINDIANNDYIYDLEDYLNKKITAIGFGQNYFGDDVELWACVDTSNYNLYLTDKFFTISRRDIFETDGNMYCRSGLVKSPIHLFSKIPNSVIEGESYFGVLESLGLGVIPNVISEEHSLLPYTDHITKTGNKYDISDILEISYSDNGLYPAEDLYPSSDIYPARRILNVIYPSAELYPSENLYPLSTPYIWYIIKYHIYKYEYINYQLQITDTNDNYLISIPIKNLTRIKSNIEYRR